MNGASIARLGGGGGGGVHMISIKLSALMIKIIVNTRENGSVKPDMSIQGVAAKYSSNVHMHNNKII